MRAGGRDARSTASASGLTLILAMFSEMVPSTTRTVCEMKPICWPSCSVSQWSSAHRPGAHPLAGRQMPTQGAHQRGPGCRSAR